MVSAARRQKIARAKAAAKAATAVAMDGQANQQSMVPKEASTVSITTSKLTQRPATSYKLTASPKTASPPKTSGQPVKISAELARNPKPVAQSAELNTPLKSTRPPRTKRVVNQAAPENKKQEVDNETDSKKPEAKKQDVKKTESKKTEPRKQEAKKTDIKKQEIKKQDIFDPTAENIDAVNFGEPFKKEKECRVYLTEGCALPASWSYAVLFGKRRDLATLILEDYDKKKLIYAWPVHLASFARPHPPYHRAWGPFSRYAHDQCEIAIKEIFDKYCPSNPAKPNDWVSLKREQITISARMEILNQLKQIFEIAKDWAKYEGVIAVFNKFVTELLDAMEDLGIKFFSDKQDVFDVIKEARVCIRAMAMVAYSAAQEGRIIKEEPKPKKKSLKHGKKGPSVDNASDAASNESGSESGEESISAFE